MNNKTSRAVALILAVLLMVVGIPATVMAAEAADAPDAWAKQEVEEAITLKLVNESLQNSYQKNITREDFCTLIMTLATLKDKAAVDAAAAGTNPFADTENKDIIAAAGLGIVTGKATDTFDPAGEITRQEAAVMLTRAAKALKMDTTAAAAAFADSAKIAAYAKEGVDFVFAKNVMNGTGDNQFSPTQSYTRQQAYMTALRLYKALDTTTAAPEPAPATPAAMTVSSTAIVGGTLADAFGKRGTQLQDTVPTRSLPLAIENAPEKAVSYAVVMIDADAKATGGSEWVHWLAADFTSAVIAENASIDSTNSIVQGKNDFGTTGYGGPTPADKAHTYKITVYALDAKLELKKDFSQADLTKAMEGHILAQATIDAKYSN